MKNLTILFLLISINTYSQGYFEISIESSAITPNSIAVGDMDSDGDIDIVTTSFQDDKILLLINSNGFGSFSSEEVISAEVDGPKNTKIADIDGDGDLDIICASQNDNTISWFENLNGLGSFSNKKVISTNLIGSNFVDLADIDGDGDLDAISASTNGSRLSFFRNNGFGNFYGEEIIDDTFDASSVAIGDIDGDGDNDVVASLYSTHSVAWYENLDGDGNFGQLNLVTSNAIWASSVALADFDADGSLDIVSASKSDNKIAWYRNVDGQGNFGDQRTICNNCMGAVYVDTADLDEDGYPDILAASPYSNRVSKFMNNGNNTFFQYNVTTKAYQANSVAVADIDNDNVIDFLATSSDPGYNRRKTAWYKSLETNKFYLAPNGVTCLCPEAEIGEMGYINYGSGIVYTKRSKEQITSLNAPTTCTTGITDMSDLFSGDPYFNGDLSRWDVSSVTNMSNMFRGTNYGGPYFNAKSMLHWDVSNVTNMSGMFRRTEIVSNDIMNWDVSNVTDMSYMFAGADEFDPPALNWDVSNVTDMSYMFAGANKFQAIGLNEWDVSNVTNMSGMFMGASSYWRSSSWYRDLSSWDVSNVTNMSYMFQGTAYNGNIGNWDVSNVTDMKFMFAFNQGINQDLSNWDVSQVQDFTSFISGSCDQYNPRLKFSTENYDKLLLAWSELDVQENVVFGRIYCLYDNLTYCRGEQARQKLITEKNWDFYDRGKDPECITCDDGIQNGDETGVDCGGSECIPCPTCDDGIQNGDETGADCGGSECIPCPTCDDGIQNGDETGVDCGGSECIPCPTCEDGIQNGDETGVDCGGPDCPSCIPETIISEGYFENGWDGWIDGGNDCRRQQGQGAYEGNYSIQLRADSGSESAMTLENINLSIFEDFTLEFHYETHNFETGEDFFLEYDDGSGFVVLGQYTYDVDFVNNESYDVYLFFNKSQLNFSTNGTLRFRSSSSNESDQVHIDQVILIGNPGRTMIQGDKSSYGSIDIISTLEKHIQLYPNPTSNLINILASGEIEVKSVSIFSATGQKLIASNEITSIDVSGLASGVYYMAIETNQGQITKSIIRK